MTAIQDRAIQAIEAQQAALSGKKETDGSASARGPSLGQRPNDRSGSASAAWMVGEQLKDICRHEPRSAELIAQDLENEAMGITEAEKKIKAYADSHRTGSFSCVTPVEAENILREFYGLPEAGAEPAPPPPSEKGNIIQLEDFF